MSPGRVIDKLRRGAELTRTEQIWASQVLDATLSASRSWAGFSDRHPDWDATARALFFTGLLGRIVKVVRGRP